MRRVAVFTRVSSDKQTTGTSGFVVDDEAAAASRSGPRWLSEMDTNGALGKRRISSGKPGRSRRPCIVVRKGTLSRSMSGR
jgi:hypothetical protein